MAKTKIDGWRCERCQHSWVPRLTDKPTICPNCKSPYWDKPRPLIPSFDPAEVDAEEQAGLNKFNERES